MSEDTTVDETAEETTDEQPASEAPDAEANGTAVAETSADEPAGEDTEPEAEAAAAENGASEADPAAASEAEDSPADPSGDRSTARVFLTESGYRVVSLWSDPEEVELRAGRHGAMVAHQLYPVGDLPEKVQRALNPLKASKKSS